MILRHVIEHVRKQEWTAIAIDFVIVVLGVFVGLQVQEWSSARADRRQEAQLIGDLRADLAVDRGQFKDALATDIHRVSAANAALVVAGLAPVSFESESANSTHVDYGFNMSTVPEFPADQRDRLWTDIVIGSHPTPSTATFDAMVGAGDMGLIGDRGIVREIQIYYNLAASVKQQNDKVLALRKDALNIGAARGLAPYAALSPDAFARQVAGDPELAATIRIMATFVIYHHGEIKAADERAAKLEDLLRRYQDKSK